MADLKICDEEINRLLKKLYEDNIYAGESIATEYSKTYEMPKSFVSYRRSRRISEARKAILREQMKSINVL